MLSHPGDTFEHRWVTGLPAELGRARLCLFSWASFTSPDPLHLVGQAPSPVPTPPSSIPAAAPEAGLRTVPMVVAGGSSLCPRRALGHGAGHRSVSVPPCRG